jgi:deoxyribonuclease V
MIACIDVDYDESEARKTRARAACVVFSSWTAATPSAEHLRELDAVPDYVPGRFFERELPCALAVLERITQPVDLVIVDGYVVLDPSGKLGLGGHLYEALECQVPVIGVAKTRFAGAPAIEVCRGDSARPLFVTALGVAPETAADHVRRMHGKFRLPTMLKRVDRLCRDGR